MALLVSIVLPARNAEATLRDALISIQRQTFEDFEVIIMDDGSTDRTAEIARSFADRRIRVLSDGKALGLARRLNQCIKLAKGRFIARMDADDVMHPDRLTRQVAEMMADPLIDVIGTDAWAIDANARILWFHPGHEPSSDPWTVAQRGMFIHPTVLGRTEWFRSNPYSDAYPRAEDHELWTRTCAHSRFAVIHEPLLYYRVRNPWRVAAELASDRTGDRLIIEYGARAGRRREAYLCVLGHRWHRLVLTFGAASGLRWLKWRLRSTTSQDSSLQKAQRELALTILFNG